MPFNPVVYPIHYLYWGSENAGDVFEFNEINSTLNWQGDTIKSGIKEHVINSKSGIDFLNTIKQICKESNCQIIYISTHGSGTELYYDDDDKCSITIQQLTATLSQCIEVDRCMTIVFGSCHTVAIGYKIENMMPQGVTKVYGFSHCPTPRQVAQLMARIVSNTEEDFIELASAIKAIPPTPIDEYLGALINCSDSIIEKQEVQEKPQGYSDRTLNSNPGSIVKIMKYNGAWVRKTYDL